MYPRRILSLACAAALFASGASHADHNSVWGEGWANMPNDIHNTRIDTLDGDNSTFQDFVRNGAGADSVNRYATDSTLATGAGAARSGGMGASRAMTGPAGRR